MALGTTGTVVVAALVAGAAGAGTTVLLRDASRPAAPAAGSDDRVVALEEKVGLQQAEISTLRARLEEAVHARPPAGPDRVVNEGRPTDSPEPEETTSATPEDMTPEEKTKFESVYHRMREKEQADARKARLAGVEANLRTRLERVPEKVALTADQKDAVVKVLTERTEKLRAIFEESRTAGTPEAARAAQEKTAAIRQESRQALLQSLTEEQVAAVEAVADRGGQGRATPAGVRNGGDGSRRLPRGNGGGASPPGGGAGGNEAGGGTNPPR